MNIFPLMALGAVAYIATRKRRRRSRRTVTNGTTNGVTNGVTNGETNGSTNGALLPANNGLGEVFASGEAPDVIAVKVGERFSVSFADNSGSTGYSWSLAASPPDDSVRFVEEKYEELELPEGLVGGVSGINYYVFEGAKPGKGSLVFHNQASWLEGKASPAQVLEIQTIIS